MRNLQAKKRTAIDGKSCWCVYDMDKRTWTTDVVLCGRFSTRKSCERAINFELRNGLNVGDKIKHPTFGLGVIAWKHTNEVGIDFDGATWTGIIEKMPSLGFSNATGTN